MNSLVETGLAQAQPPYSPQQLIEALLAALPAHCVLFREEDTRPYECDGLSLYRALPAVVALPETEEQVQAVMRICKRLNAPVVARGAGTGLSGGAMPHSQGVLLGLSVQSHPPHRSGQRHRRGRARRAQPGDFRSGRSLRLVLCARSLQPDRLFHWRQRGREFRRRALPEVRPDRAQRAARARGHHRRRRRRTGSEAPDAPGLDLLSVFIGSEGMLGVVTEVTVKLIPKPACAQVVMASFASVEAAGNAVTQVIAAGMIPAGLEMMDRRATHMVEPFVRAGYDMDAQAILLCESDGTPEEVAHEIARMEAVFRDAGATRCQVSASEAERLKFWAGRKNAFPAAGRVSPDYYCMDGTIPRRHLARVLGAIEQMEDDFGLRCANVFHAGDGNLHPLILFDSNKPDEVERAEKFGAAILELCVQVGGTVTGEHGVGMEKINQMCVQFSREELDAFLAVKRAFDPPCLLNPEKVIPTLARCAEYGKMHVHGES